MLAVNRYTVSDLYRYIKTLEDDADTQKRFRRRALCETLAGNTVEVLTVTSFTSDPDALKHRKGIVLSARVHPGESNASFMMQARPNARAADRFDAHAPPHAMTPTRLFSLYARPLRCPLLCLRAPCAHAERPPAAGHNRLPRRPVD